MTKNAQRPPTKKKKENKNLGQKDPETWHLGDPRTDKWLSMIISYVPVWNLAVPLKDIYRVVKKSLFCYLGCMLRVVVLLEEPSLQWVLSLTLKLSVKILPIPIPFAESLSSQHLCIKCSMGWFSLTPQSALWYNLNKLLRDRFFMSSIGHGDNDVF